MALKPLAPLLRGYHVVLASASPRRREILDLAGVVFDVIPSHFSEVPPPEHLLRPQDLVIANAKGKALDVGMRLSQVREAPVESRLGFCEDDGGVSGCSVLRVGLLVRWRSFLADPETQHLIIGADTIVAPVTQRWWWSSTRRRW
ncbi:N-acetylserotonin O-methyltransferase-like protein isoform X2 [Rattus norvegicus]|uniref:N-acetylserotonin O-methyltransferase-like protein isoform X2 n=1 Tax=Rattus norvegicus TaxID=10116 RepID=UPI0019174EDD|nr:N-acetylserotonin O-methyltransferase-like protein isoform X3 [Rattus norvegicus]